jgi:transcription elongation factor GreA
MGSMSNGEAITPEGLEALKAELARLEGDARRDIARRIKVARELGDLSENAEYHIAKEDQAHLETKILRLTERLRNARVVKAPAQSDVVVFGTTVHVVDEATGRASAFTLVGPTEANVREGKLSAESPMAKALMGHRPGDDVAVQTPRGVRRYRVERVGD